MGWGTVDGITGETISAYHLGPGDLVSSWILDPDVLEVQYDVVTVLRNLIVTAVSFEPAAATLQYALLCQGLIVATEGMDLTTPPSPYYDQDYDWLWIANCQSDSFPIAGTGQSVLSGARNSDYFDIRSKRKIPNGHGLLYVAHLAPGSTLESSHRVDGRLLLAH
jgi:hypothetical protein